MDRDHVARQVTGCLKRHADTVAAGYLFGSVARGDARAGSDVDIGIILAAGRPQRLTDFPITIQTELESALATSVDLVVMNGAAPDLLHRILRDGLVVFEDGSTSRVEFEVQARNAWFDLQPVLERYRKTILGSL